MATITFSTKSKNSPVNIYLRFTAGRALNLSRKTDLWVDLASWDQKKQQIRNVISIENRDEINLKLAKLKIFILEQYNNSFSEGELINNQWLERSISSFFNRPKHETKKKNLKHHLFVTDFADHWLEFHAAKWKVGPGKYMSPQTAGNYFTLNEIVKEFEGKKKLQLREINGNDIDNFISYLFTNKYSKKTIERMIGRLKFFLARATEQNLGVNQSYLRPVFIPDNENECDDVYLTEEEINSVFRLDLSDNDLLDAARDYFVIGTRTALRISDLLHNLSTDNIEKGVIKLKTKKTGANVVIPLHPNCVSILNKRLGNLPAPMPDNQYNKFIKEVCRLAGITKMTYGRVFDQKIKRKVYGYYPKYLLITSHVGRRSFVSTMRGSIPDQSLSVIGGWASEKLLPLYDKTTKSEHAEILAKHFNQK